MKIKTLLLIGLATFTLIACNGGGGSDSSGGSGGEEQGNKDDALPVDLQTYSYVANQGNSTISICTMTLNGYYRSPCRIASAMDNVVPSPTSIAVNKSNNTVFVTGISSGAQTGYIQNCTINQSTNPDKNGLLSCGNQQILPGFSTPVAIATYYGTGGNYAFIADSFSKNIYACTINNNDQVTTICSQVAGPLNGAPLGVAINTNTGSSNDTLYVSVNASTPQVINFTIPNGYTGGPLGGTSGTISNNNTSLINLGPAKMVFNPKTDYLYVSIYNSSTIAEYSTNSSATARTSTQFDGNDGIAINSLYTSTDPRLPKDNNAFIYVANLGVKGPPYISKCPILGDGTLANCSKLGSGFNSPRGIAISGPIYTAAQ